MYRFSFLILGLIVGGVLMSNLHGVSAQFIDDFIDSYDLATDPTNGECLTTDGTNNIWSSSCGGGSGTPGGSNTQVQFNNGGSFAGDSGFTYSSSTDILSVVSINATNSTTTRLAVTGTGTTTFAGGINTGANHIVTHGVQSDASDGLHIHAGNGTDVGLFGAGNTANSLFYGGVNIDGATRIATTTNGVLTATAGAITASGTPYVTSIVATGTTATSTFAGAVGIGTTTPLSLLTVQGTAHITSDFKVNGGTFFVDATNNRVGIGTTTPTMTLSVVGESLFSDNINMGQLLKINAPTGNPEFDFLENGTIRAKTYYDVTNNRLTFQNNETNNNDALYFSDPATFISNIIADTDTFVLDSTNNRIGIGTTTPTQALSVVGNVLLLPTTTTTSGIIYKGTDRFIHDFNYGNNGTVTTDGFNTFVGVRSGNTTMGSTASSAFHSSYNTGLGYLTLTNNTTGFGNMAMGYLSLTSNTTGGGNTAIGSQSLQANTSAFNNTAIGYLSMNANTSGSNNTGLGTGALYANTVGTNNIGIGSYAGRYLADGTTANVGASSSIYIGQNVRSASAGSANEIVIGSGITGNGTNTATYGSSTISSLFTGRVGIGTTTPMAILSVMGTSSSKIAQFTTSSGLKLLEMLSTGSTTANGTWDFSGATVKQHTYKSFSFPTFATTTSATTTIDLGTAYTTELWSGADCYTTSGSGAFIFTDGTNRMNGATATTTVSRTTLSTNNTFTAQEKRYVEVGALTNAKLVCTVDVIVNN